MIETNSIDVVTLVNVLNKITDHLSRHVSLQSDSDDPVNLIHLWNGGPDEAHLSVQLRTGSHVAIPALKQRLRSAFAAHAATPGAAPCLPKTSSHRRI